MKAEINTSHYEIDLRNYKLEDISFYTGRF